MTSTDTIRIELQDGLAILSLAQPARGNPFDGAFGRDFKQALENTAAYSALSIALILPFSVGFGVLIYQVKLRGSAVRKLLWRV